jgi:hypothetical protein
MKTTLDPYSENAPEVCLLWKECWKAWVDRKRQVEGEKGKMDEKRVRKPHRYRCAAVGCEIEADKGRMLLQCSFSFFIFSFLSSSSSPFFFLSFFWVFKKPTLISNSPQLTGSGKCDSDKKPSYCGKECQRADWKNHKSFCKPGAACSVIDTGASSHGMTKPNALQIPITMADGKTVLVSSSTMDAKELKEFKGAADGMPAGGDTMWSMVSSMVDERVKLDGGNAEEEKESEVDD